MILTLGLLVAYAVTASAVQTDHVITSPAYRQLSPYAGIPPTFEDRLVYYNSFEGDRGSPQISELQTGKLEKEQFRAGGIRGRCAAAEKGQYLELTGNRLSPHLPLTVAFWWALGRDGKPESAFQLLHLTNGRGFVSHFSRGRGKWCALDQPAGVLQVYHLDGVANVNAIYDRHLADHIDLKKGVWHHSAIVISAASRIEAYTDGRRVCTVRIRGRRFNASDRMHALTIGSRWGLPMALDEVFVLRRAVTGEQIADYVTSARQMDQVGYPL